MRGLRAVLIAIMAFSIALVTAASAAAAPGQRGGGDETTTLSLGSLRIANSAPQVVDEAIFADNGVSLDITYAMSGAAIVPGVIGGDYDIGYGSVVSVIQAVEQGLPIRIIANGDISVGEIVVLADGEISEAADLEGKVVATNALKSTVDLETSVSVEERGGDPSEIEYLEVPFPAQLAALDSGTIDAAVLPEPFLSQAKADPKYEALFSIFDVEPQDLTNCYFASESFLSDNGYAAQDFVRSIRDANRFATDNPDAAREAVTAITEAPPAAVESIELPTWLGKKVKRKEVKIVVRRMVEFELIPESVAARDIIWSGPS